ncbi:MAG: thioredoxin family protein [Elusimicrobia bacterium]|nr:thioredoxin family protein [Elusimicrobiota bacterium]
MEEEEKKICENGRCEVGVREREKAMKLRFSDGESRPEFKTEIFLFGKTDCPVCGQAKEIVNKIEGVKFTYFDLDSLDGLSKAAFYNAFEIPVTIFFKNGREVRRWEKTAPPFDDLLKLLPTE